METGSSTAPCQSVGQTLFILYKLCRFALDAGVPGLALNRSPYVWLTLNGLLRFTSNEIQAAGIQTAVFIPCGNGVIELGTTNLVQADEQNNSRISRLLASVIVAPNISVPMLMPGTTISTSSCSSLPACSIDSPEGSSLVRYPIISPVDQINIPPPIVMGSANGFYPYLQTLQLPSSSELLISGHDHEAALRSSSQISVSDMRLFPKMSKERNMMLSAFDMWRPPSKVQTPPVVKGQYILKRCLAIFRNILAERLRQISMSGSHTLPGRMVSSRQVHHIISERRRREELKEKFQALRSLLPQISRKDKVSMLAYTREHLSSLKSRLEQLEETNKQLESELKKLLRAQSQESAGTSTALQQGSASTEGSDSVVTVEVLKLGGSTVADTCDEMGILVVVDGPTNTIDLMTALLKCLREMGVPLISMTTCTTHHEHDPSRLQLRMTATMKLQDHEVEEVKEALLSAVRKDCRGPPLSS